MKRPNFIGVGGHKCASTWFAEVLRSNPDIFISSPKEIGYFNDHYNKGLEWYLSHFKFSKNEKLLGEFTSYYLYDEVTALRMFEDLGGIKILAVVREPVARALSQIKHGVRKRLLEREEKIDIRTLKQYILDYPEITERSFYFNGLTKFIEIFGKENVLIINYDDIKNRPFDVMGEVATFLEVGNNFNFHEKQIGVGITPKYQILEDMRRVIFRLLRSNPFIIPFFRKSGISMLYRRLNANRDVQLTEEARSYLASLFREDWQRTFQLINQVK